MLVQWLIHAHVGHTILLALGKPPYWYCGGAVFLCMTGRHTTEVAPPALIADAVELLPRQTLYIGDAS